MSPEDTFKALHELRDRADKIHQHTEVILDRLAIIRGESKKAERTYKYITYYIEEIKKLSTLQGVELH